MSVTKTFNITLDVTTPLSNEEFRVKQGDTGNVFVITLVDDGAAVDLTNCRVVALFTKGDRLAMQDNWTDEGGIAISGDSHNIITIELFNGSFVPGLNECEIQVYSGDDLDVLVTSASFNFRCARSLINEDTIISMEEYTLLTSLIASVQGVINGAQSNWTEADINSLTFIRNKPDVFPPQAHASAHAVGGVDEVTPTSIGALEASVFNAHAARHSSGGTDALDPASIGAAVVRAEQVILTPSEWVGTEAPFTKQMLVNRATASCHLIPAPAPGYEEAYADCQMKVSAQGDRTLTFSCENKPESNILANVLIIYGNEEAYQGITTDTDDIELSNAELLSMWNR